MSFGPNDFTAEQAAAYVNGTCLVALSELLSMHWANEHHKMLAEAKRADPGSPPFPPQKFQDRIAMHCVTHDNILSLFERAQGK